MFRGPQRAAYSVSENWILDMSYLGSSTFDSREFLDASSTNPSVEIKIIFSKSRNADAKRSASVDVESFTADFILLSTYSAVFT